MKTAIIVFCLCLVLTGGEVARQKRAITEQDKIAFKQQINSALQELQTSYKTIPDQSGKEGKLSYSFTNIQITSLTLPEVDAVEAGPDGLRLSINGAGISLRSDFRLSYKFLFTFRTSGDITASVSGLSLAVTATVQDLNDGRIKISLTDCQSSVDRVNLRIGGSITASILNLFKGKAERKVRDMIPKKICDQVRDYIIRVNP